MENILTKFGLTENESNIYIAYISHPLKSAAEVSRILKMDKSSTYKAVENLTKHGLLIQSGYNKAFTYKAANPDSLKQLYLERKTELELQKSSLDSFVQKLKQESTESRNTFITYETGIDNLQKRITESLECKEKLIRERWRYHTHLDIPEHVEYILKYAKERAKRKIFMRQLEPSSDTLIKRLLPTEESPRIKLRTIRENPNLYFKEIRAIPEELCDNNSFRIWDDCINIVSFDEDNNYIIITIKDKYVAQMMKNMFDFIWFNCKKD